MLNENRSDVESDAVTKYKIGNNDAEDDEITHNT